MENQQRWIVSKDQTSATVTGRTPISFWTKLNPIWWFQNNAEQNLSQAPWYKPASPQWWRQISWNLRNPLQNFRAFVIGVEDRNYTVTGRAPVLTVQRSDLGETGWQWCFIWLKTPRLFFSYSGKHVIWYAGWQPTGFFGFKFNLTGLSLPQLW